MWLTFHPYDVQRGSIKFQTDNRIYNLYRQPHLQSLRFLVGRRKIGSCEVRRVAGKRVASPEYRAWQLMRNRVLNSRCKDYPRYGGRGIAIARAWDTFEGFLSDMGRKPSSAHTLDRKQNDENYCRGNCHWATRQDQAQNRGSYNTCSQAMADEIRRTYVRGVTRQIDLAERYGLTQAHVSQIIRNAVWAPRETELDDA